MSIATATNDAMQEIKRAGGEICAVNMPRCFGFNSGLEIGIRPSFQVGKYDFLVKMQRLMDRIAPEK